MERLPHEPVNYRMHPLLNGGAILPGGCHALSQVWVGRLNNHVYSAIELTLANGQRVIVKRLSAEAMLRRNIRQVIRRAKEQAKLMKPDDHASDVLGYLSDGVVKRYCE